MFRRQKGSASKKVWEALGKTNNQCNNVYLADGKNILRTQQTPKMSIQHERKSLTKFNQRKWTYRARHVTNYTAVTFPQRLIQTPPERVAMHISL
jgi:hypothetical protein